MSRITDLTELNQPFKAGRAWLCAGDLMLHPDDLARAGITDRADVAFDRRTRQLAICPPTERCIAIHSRCLCGQPVKILRLPSQSNFNMADAIGLYQIQWRGDTPAIIVDDGEAYQPSRRHPRHGSSYPWVVRDE